MKRTKSSNYLNLLQEKPLKLMFRFEAIPFIVPLYSLRALTLNNDLHFCKSWFEYQKILCALSKINSSHDLPVSLKSALNQILSSRYDSQIQNEGQKIETLVFELKFTLLSDDESQAFTASFHHRQMHQMQPHESS